jgi:hypothetical protein
VHRIAQSGLKYYYARYSDPRMGWFLMGNVIVPNLRDAQSYNRYANMRGNPIVKSDPTKYDCLGFCSEGIGLGSIQLGEIVNGEM